MNAHDAFSYFVVVVCVLIGVYDYVNGYWRVAAFQLILATVLLVSVVLDSRGLLPKYEVGHGWVAGAARREE